jgi:uncharacterized protein
LIEIGRVGEIVRYPVKSMAGAATESAFLGWHGLAGDRRFAFRRVGENGGFPWLSASRLPELLLYHPCGLDERSGEPLPTHVRTPTGSKLELGSSELNTHVTEQLGRGVELLRLNHGVFDEATLSVISLATVSAIGREAGLDLDRRRFRANIVVETLRDEPFLEDQWVDGTLLFGEGELQAVVRVTLRDARCVMINLDPETGEASPGVMKAVVNRNEANAGVYATVVRTGMIRAGDRVRFASESTHPR